MSFMVFLCKTIESFKLFLFLMLPPPPVMHNFRFKASVEHGNKYHIKRKLCITGGGQCSIDQKPLLIKKGIPQGSLVFV